MLDDFLELAWSFSPKLITAIIVLVSCWYSSRWIERVVETATRKFNSSLSKLFGSASKYCFRALAIVVALGTIGIDVTALVAGLGLTGFALGFALKDIISNSLSGVLLLMFRPFKVGDFISVGTSEGTVTEINMRYTVLASGDKEVFVPNATLFTNTVVVRRIRIL